ncbi:glycosyltransferase family 1 protein [Croceitalea sp. MTPC5]|uniref:glycosyltransferase family 4 protein n=1 Tax=Croceitalea sp. MTPC5 TaxID=3056565 RepID=UPI002B3655D5|nr:glycosyltransferase family 1 protein [Croceitalea sp. MTPC5]
MRIGYDAKRIFHNNTGLGNYGRDIVRILNTQSLVEHFFLFNTKKSHYEEQIPLEKATIVYPKGLFWKTFPSLWRLIGQWKQINSSNVDWYHGLSGEIPIQLKKNYVPKIVTIHDLIFLSHPKYYNFFDRIIYKLKFQYAVSVADHIIAISEQTKADIIKFLNVDAKKITVIHQGCNKAFKLEYNEVEKRAIQKKFQLPEHYVLNVGTIQERKNALSLVKAIHRTTFHLVLVGQEKSYARKIHDYIAENNLKHQVSFIKNISSTELAILYQNATVFCYPSFCEGFGIPIIEALYSKLPVITTQNGCFPEAAGPDAIYIDPNDIDQIRVEITKLFENQGMRDEMAEKGYRYVQRFSDENVANNLLQLYKSIA